MKAFLKWIGAALASLIALIPENWREFGSQDKLRRSALLNFDDLHSPILDEQYDLV